LEGARALDEPGLNLKPCRLFLHGPGGSGKTFCMTEVVLPVVKAFCGERGVKALAATNSAARLIKGKTMHAASKLTRKQSLSAKALKPNSTAMVALQSEWGKYASDAR